ncbi:unnamed protein product [Lepidochelys olivacea]
MTLSMLLVFLSIIHSALQLLEWGRNLDNNKDLKRCIQAHSSSSITTAFCNQDTESQKYRWVSDHQLMSVALRLCLGVPSKKDQVMITLYPCNKTSELQHWECRNETLLAIQGEDLFFNSGSREKGNLMLQKESGVRSKWKIYGTTDDLCSQGYEDLFTLLGNANGAPCVFPFKLSGKWYAECTDAARSDGLLWCGTTADFDTDQLCGFCPLKYNETHRFWTTDPLTGIHYQINFQSALTWHQVWKSCQQQKAELLSITEIHEQMYLRDLIDRMRSALWIGLNSLNFNYGWQWSGGSPFRYLNWALGNPSLEPEKMCSVLNPRGGAKWENRECDQKIGYIYKRKNSTLDSFSLPSEFSASSKCPEGWLPYTGHCYMIHSEPKMWKEALTSCTKEDGDLASIHNIEEHSFIVSQLGYKSTDELWIGLNDLRIQMYFEWSDKMPVTYTKWLRGEPTHANSRQEECVVMKGQEAKKACERSKGYLTTVGDRYEQAYLTSLIGLRPEKYFWIGLSDVEKHGTFKWTNGEAVLFTHWNSAMPGTEFMLQNFCREIGGDLAAINSKEEEEVIQHSIVDKGLSFRPFWIGLFCLDPDEGFFWSNGSPMRYKNWYNSEPSNEHGNEHCGTVNEEFSMDWINTHCEHFNDWICQIEKGSWRDGSPVHYVAWAKNEPDYANAEENCVVLYKNFAELHILTFVCRKACARFPSLPSSCIFLSYKHLFGFIPAFLTYHLKDAKTDAWIGLNDINSELHFVWADGSGVYYTNWIAGSPVVGEIILYDSLQPETGNNLHQLDCVVEKTAPVDKIGQWKDEPCYEARGFICQMGSDPKLSHSPTTIPASDFTRCGDSGYLVIRSKMKWEEARKNCQEKSSELASILDPYSQSFLWLQVLEYGEPVWIALNSNVTNGNYKWMDKWRMCYSKWASDEPKQTIPCVYLDLDGTWKTASCDQKFFSVCKQSDVMAPTDSPQLFGRCPESEEHRSWVHYRSHCYYIESSYTRNWAQASRECTRLDATLASIEDHAESIFLSHKAT